MASLRRGPDGAWGEPVEYDGFRITRHRSPGDLAPEAADCLFTHPAYLSAHLSAGDLLQVRDESGRGGLGAPVYFADRGDHIAYLGRLDRMEARRAYQLAALLLERTSAKFILFEDVELEDECGERPLPSLFFDYKANWRVDLAPDAVTLSSSQRRQARSKLRKLSDAVEQPPRFEFSRADDGFLDAVVAMNRDRVTRSGRRHHLSDEKFGALKDVSAALGYRMSLHAGDHLIAGDLVCVTGSRAYVMVLGFDETYERFSPGLLVHSRLIEELRAIGCTEMNLLWGDSPWKARLGARRVPLSTLAITRQPWTQLTPAFWNVCAEHGIATAKEFAKRRIHSVWT